LRFLRDLLKKSRQKANDETGIQVA